MKYENCSFCNGSVKPERIDTEFWWGDRLVVFEHVPAGVCENCGEQYFRGEVYEKMVKVAQSKTEDAPRTMVVPAWDFVGVELSK